MAKLIVNSGETDQQIRQRAQNALGGDVQITEQRGGERVVHLSGDQSRKFNRMKPDVREEAFGGRVRQQLDG
jgi:hypothetical protein